MDLLVWGETAPQALALLGTVQRAYEIQMTAKGLNDELTETLPAVLEQCTRLSLQCDPEFGAGVDVFSALLRQIDRYDQTYKG